MLLARILVLCTGNSCRSQMAEGVLKSLDSGLEVYSAGTDPAAETHPHAVTVMSEVGISISDGYPKNVDQFLDQPFDYLITVCGGARETCPTFSGQVANRIHIGFDDPAKAEGGEEEVMAFFRRVRDEIREGFTKFYSENLKSER
jgi:arsenate reductase (thioredoxin)